MFICLYLFKCLCKRWYFFVDCFNFLLFNFWIDELIVWFVDIIKVCFLLLIVIVDLWLLNILIYVVFKGLVIIKLILLVIGIFFISNLVFCIFLYFFNNNWIIVKYCKLFIIGFFKFVIFFIGWLYVENVIVNLCLFIFFVWLKYWVEKLLCVYVFLIWVE